MTQREEFEAWFHKYDDNNFMTAEDRELMFEAWQAARAQAVPDASTSISKPMPSGYMLNTLIKFQKWRIGEDERTLDEAGLTPRSITLAIDWAIEQLVDILLAVNDEDSYCD